MCTLAHVFEAAGLATVGLGSIREQVVNTAPPRGLFCDFPLGRPLGKPGDAAFQHRVLDHAFSMLQRTSPGVETFAESVPDAGSEMLVCPLPPRHDPDAHAAVDEARGLRAAYDRAIERHGNGGVSAMDWKQLLVYISGSVEEELLLRLEYLVAENRILRDQIKGRIQLSDTERRPLAPIGKQPSQHALEEVASIVKSDTILAWHRKRVAQKFDGPKYILVRVLKYGGDALWHTYVVGETGGDIW